MRDTRWTPGEVLGLWMIFLAFLGVAFGVGVPQIVKEKREAQEALNACRAECLPNYVAVATPDYCVCDLTKVVK